MAVVVEPELPESRINGAVRWISPDKALLQLSYRYKWFDVFWFSFFHEAGHLLKHGKRLSLAEDRPEDPELMPKALIEDGTQDPELEQEANDFARKALIPTERVRTPWLDQRVGHRQVCKEDRGCAGDRFGEASIRWTSAIQQFPKAKKALRIMNLEAALRLF